MSNLLELTTDWLEVYRDIKNKKRLITKYPDDASLQVELQELEKREKELKGKN